ncbi:MAG TPA: YdeI/OmpD-associated family protein [Ohtaekwangia sp.]|nr:YdeI/OmpD-associated family protein [Ohtaekwangia sp.]
MEKVNGIRTFNPTNRKAWRKWLASHYTSSEAVAVVIYGKNSKTPNLTYGDAVEEALCYGWIDNKAMKRDGESMYLQFVPRREKSNWSKLNRDRAEKLIAQGLMRKAGQRFIDLAKSSGQWDAALETDIIPADLQKAFNKKKKAYQHFQAFPPSSRRMILQWIRNAKRPETRAVRIEKTVALAAENIKSRP